MKSSFFKTLYTAAALLFFTLSACSKEPEGNKPILDPAPMDTRRHPDTDSMLPVIDSDICPNDTDKTDPGECGCGQPEKACTGVPATEAPRNGDSPPKTR